jgi:hypothetical protein
MASSGVQVLIPDTGKELEWVAHVDAAGDLFVAGAWIVVFAGLVGLFALVGFYDALKDAGPIVIIAPIAGVVGLTLVTISHVVPITIAYELVPAYTDGNASVAQALAPASSVIEGLSSIGFLAFFVFLASMGIALLRRKELPAPGLAPA